MMGGGFSGGYQYSYVAPRVPVQHWMKRGSHCWYLYRDDAVIGCYYDNEGGANFYWRIGDSWSIPCYPPWNQRQ